MPEGTPIRPVVPAAISPLTWIRWDCAALSNQKWLRVPLDERGVWGDIVRLAAKERGRLPMTAAEIAFVICPHRGEGGDLDVVERTIARFMTDGAMKRDGKGFIIVNFARYNPPTRFLSQSQRSVSREAINPEQPRLALRAGDVRDETYETNETDGSIHIAENAEPDVHRHDGLLIALDRVPGWVAREDDLDWLDGIVAAFPVTDIPAEVLGFESWSRDHRLGKNPRLALRNWLKNSVRYEVERATKERKAPKGASLPSIAIQKQRIHDGLNPLTGEPV